MHTQDDCLVLIYVPTQNGPIILWLFQVAPELMG